MVNVNKSDYKQQQWKRRNVNALQTIANAAPISGTTGRSFEFDGKTTPRKFEKFYFKVELWESCGPHY